MKKIKILLVDDNDNTRASIRQLLELDDVVDIVGRLLMATKPWKRLGSWNRNWFSWISICQRWMA